MLECSPVTGSIVCFAPWKHHIMILLTMSLLTLKLNFLMYDLLKDGSHGPTHKHTVCIVEHMMTLSSHIVIIKLAKCAPEELTL